MRLRASAAATGPQCVFTPSTTTAVHMFADTGLVMTTLSHGRPVAALARPFSRLGGSPWHQLSLAFAVVPWKNQLRVD
jgi:hypothetical protein